MFIYLNKYAGSRRAGGRFRDVEVWLAKNFSDRNIIVETDKTNLCHKIIECYSGGERMFIAAGGDGTVNILLNELMQLNNDMRDNIAFGAIGLGSSNDFHKPYSGSSYINRRIPCKLKYGNAVVHNVGKINYISENYYKQTRYFIINCSLGIVAYANYLFNDHDRIIRLLKKTATGSAIWFAGLKSLIKFKNTRCSLILDDEIHHTGLSNLSVLIKPNFSGNFCYNIEVGPQSDFLAFALCENMNARQRLRTIGSLAKGKFRALPGTRIWQGASIEIKSPSILPLEIDGEVVMARDIKIKLIKAGLRVCA